MSAAMWAQSIVALLGVLLMAGPGVFGYSGTPADNHWVVGPLVSSFAVIALWEATRAVRWVNVVLGLWVAGSAWWFDYPLALSIPGTATGLAIAGLAAVGGRLSHRFGGGWRALAGST